MSAKKTAAKKVVAKKAPVKPADDLAPVDARVAQYSDEDNEKVNALREADVALTGTETSEELDALLASISDEGGESEADEEDEDLADLVAPRYEMTQVDNKPRRFGVHFVLEKNGKRALYNEKGQRISPVYGQDDILAGSDSNPTNAWRSIARSAAKNNAERRRNMRPEDYLPA